MNIGSRPAKRKAAGGIGTLRAIPWIFAWTQTRFHLPVWLGVGEAMAKACAPLHHCTLLSSPSAPPGPCRACTIANWSSPRADPPGRRPRAGARDVQGVALLPRHRRHARYGPRQGGREHRQAVRGQARRAGAARRGRAPACELPRGARGGAVHCWRGLRPRHRCAPALELAFRRPVRSASSRPLNTTRVQETSTRQRPCSRPSCSCARRTSCR